MTRSLDTIARQLDGVPRQRKALVLFSEGIDYNVGDVMGRVQRYGSDVTREMQQAIGALMRSNVSLYAIDPRGLSSADGDRVETPLYRQPARTNDLTNPGIEGEHAASIRSLRHLSESTGGFAVVDTNDYAGAYERIVAENSEYYVLGYTPSHPGRPGQFREISVRVTRPGVRVVARRGYIVPAPLRN